MNLGERPLDEYRAAAVELGVPVFLHPLLAAGDERVEIRSASARRAGRRAHTLAEIEVT